MKFLKGINLSTGFVGLMIFGVLVIGSTKVYGQTGTLEGRVVDAVDGESLPSANVMIENTNRGTTTDLDNGEFILRRFPVGEHNIVVSFMGYHRQVVSVTIEEDETTWVEVELEPDVMEGEEVTVSAQAQGQAQAIQRQLDASSIVNVASEARIRELADANAAEAVGRMSGVSVIRDAGEGRQVAIRGLAPEYNNITVDGVRLPGTDLESRAVDLNMISQEMLQGIEIYKSNRPDQDADAIGGSVNFSLAGAPEGRNYRANLKGGYNNHVQEAGNFGVSLSGSDRFYDNRLGAFLSLDIERNDRSSELLAANYTVFRDAREDEEFAPLEILNARFGDREEVRDRMGGSLYLDYELDNGRLWFSSFINRLDRDEVHYRRGLNVEDFRLDWRVREREVQVDVLSNRLAGEHDVFDGRALVEWRASRSVSQRGNPFDRRFRFEQNGGFNDEFVDETQGISGILPGAKDDYRETYFYRSEEFGSDVREREFVGSVDITVPVQTGWLSGDIKFGGKHFNKERKRENALNNILWNNDEEMEMLVEGLQQAGHLGEEIIFTETGQYSMENFLDQEFEGNENIFDGRYSDFSPFPARARSDLLGILNEEQFDTLHIPRGWAMFSNNGLTEATTAGYLMAELNIGRRLMIMPGFRYEYIDGEYRAKKGSVTDPRNPVDDIVIGDTTSTTGYGQFFPMIQGRYRMTPWFDIRAAYTQSTSRPGFNELVPREGANSNSRTLSRGNPYLEPLTSHNYDLFFTFHGNRLGLLTFGGFYKEIEDLIYYRQITTLTPEELDLPPRYRFYQVTEPINNEELTTVRGIEVEWQSNFIFLPRPFSGLVLNANVTRMWSETHFPISELRRTSEGTVRWDSVRAGNMPHQPDLVANVSVGYEIGGFSSRLSYNFQGETLTRVGARRETDHFSEDFVSWDLALRQKITGGFSLFANVYNITNEVERDRQFTGEFLTHEEYFNWTAELGVRMQF